MMFSAPGWTATVRLIALLAGLLVATGCRTPKPSAAEPPETSPAPGTPTVSAPPVVPPQVTGQTEGTTLTTNQPVVAPAIPTTQPQTDPVAPTNTFATRTGDEIVVAGQLFHTGTRVVLWSDTNGYNGYSLHNHFPSGGGAAKSDVSRRRYDRREGSLAAAELARIRTSGWDLPALQRVVDQFVLHYDVAGTSRQCFYILHDRRFLSVHFMLDLDGTIYQTLDVQERARHAGTANDRSVGIEIANIGAYAPTETETLDQWYAHDTNSEPHITLPARFGDGGLLTPGFVARPARAEAVTNMIHDRWLVQYDFTPEQYNALAHLTAALCRALPQIQCDAPRDPDGQVRTDKLPDEELENFRGLVGHYHLTTNKIDPGPAFDWEKLIREAQHLLEPAAGPSEPPPQSP